MHNIILKAVNPKDENPFRQFPRLKNIWLPELAILAEESIDDAFEYLSSVQNADIGEIFLIYAETPGEKELIGITGYFPDPEATNECMLRWHGIFKEYQKFGYSKEIIFFIASHVKEKYQEAENLVEFMPIIESYVHVKNYFEKIGFKKRGNPEKVDWSSYEWQSYCLELKPFQKKISKNYSLHI